MHQFTDSLLHPTIGFCTAVASTAALKLAQVVTDIAPGAKGWIETGGTMGLIGGLAYGTITLWRDNLAQKKELANLNAEIRKDWKEQNERLINVLEKLERGE